MIKMLIGKKNWEQNAGQKSGHFIRFEQEKRK